MKIDTLQDDRYNLAIELLLQRKDSLVYKNVVFYWEKVWDKDKKTLTDKEKFIISTSSEYNIENTTISMAKDKISYSKIILKEIMYKSKILREELIDYDITFKFGIDYGNGGIDLAIEEENEFRWLKNICK